MLSEDTDQGPVDCLKSFGLDTCVIRSRALYESPFTDINPLGPDGLFESGIVDRLVGALQSVRARAIPV